MTVSLVRLGVLGDPLTLTRSPDLHRAGLSALGIAGESAALRTPAAGLGERLAELAQQRYLGVNLTHPLKEVALEHMARVSEEARLARSINTIGLSPDGWWGDTTDGPGFVDLLRSLGRDPARERAVFLGAGGAARSAALAVAAAGAADITVSTRRPEAMREAWRGIPGVRLVAWASPDQMNRIREATLVINATPLTGDDALVAPADIPGPALVVDMVYGAGITPWVQHARAQGREAYDGLGLLVFQARRSLALWLGRAVPLDPLARAVGWPR